MAIGLDIGSSSVKAIRLEGAGRAVATARRAIRTRTRSGGRVEHDAEAIVRAAREALLEAARGARDRPLGIATQRSTVLFWDPGSGRPLTPAYSWQDRRGRALCARLGPDAAAAIATRTGLRLSPHYSASKLAWALRHVRGLARRVAAGRALWGTLGTFLVWRLSGGAIYAVDHANAQRTLLFDLDRLAWDAELFEWFGLRPLLDAPALPALLPTMPGAALPLAAGPVTFRLAALTGDQQAALIGAGCRVPGGVAINYGSGAFVLRHVGREPRRVRGLLTSLLASWRRGSAGPPSLEARFAVEGTVNAAATALEWAERRLGRRVPVRVLDRFLAPVLGGPPRLHFLPAVSGLGAPRWDPAARPFFAGDARGAGDADRMRAVVEAIAYRCAEILRAAGGGAGRGGAPVVATGGLTRCRTLVQAQADLLQRPILVRDLKDATGLGAALLAARGPEALRAPAARGGRDVLVRPRLPAAEAGARYRAWAAAVYGGAPSGRRRGAGTA
jgi:glycerol kinase